MLGFIKRFFRRRAIESMRLTNDFYILNALNLLDTVDDKYISILSGENASKCRYFIEFELIEKYTKGLEAVTGFKKNDLRIYINPRNVYAPPEAIACLIANETFHQDKELMFEEEYQSMLEEVKVWKKLKTESDHPLVKRLNILEKAYDNGELRNLVQSLPAYKDLK